MFINVGEIGHRCLKGGQRKDGNFVRNSTEKVRKSTTPDLTSFQSFKFNQSSSESSITVVLKRFGSTDPEHFEMVSLNF
jgi:hypothetical protein